MHEINPQVRYLDGATDIPHQCAQTQTKLILAIPVPQIRIIRHQQPHDQDLLRPNYHNIISCCLYCFSVVWFAYNDQPTADFPACTHVDYTQYPQSPFIPSLGDTADVHILPEIASAGHVEGQIHWFHWHGAQERSESRVLGQPVSQEQDNSDHRRHQQKNGEAVYRVQSDWYGSVGSASYHCV